MTSLTETNCMENVYYSFNGYQVVHRLISYYLRSFTRGQRLERDSTGTEQSTKWNDECDRANASNDHVNHMITDHSNRNDMIARVIEILIVISLNHMMYTKLSQQQSSIIEKNTDGICTENQTNDDIGFDYVNNDDHYETQTECVGKKRDEELIPRW